MAEQYFTDHAPALEDDLHLITMSVRGTDLQMWVSPKVFSSTRLDLGTRQLLAEAPPLPPEGTFLDIGCGWGPIAVSMASESPAARVWAVDVNSRALDLTRRNAAVNECDNVIALSEEEALSRIRAEDTRFDVIWSNPPIRIGKGALHALLLTWLARLAPTGRAFLVVSKNLGADSLISWLNAQGYSAAKIASKKGYRIIEVAPE